MSELELPVTSEARGTGPLSGLGRGDSSAPRGGGNRFVWASKKERRSQSSTALSSSAVERLRAGTGFLARLWLPWLLGIRIQMSRAEPGGTALRTPGRPRSPGRGPGPHATGPRQTCRPAARGPSGMAWAGNGPSSAPTGRALTKGIWSFFQNKYKNHVKPLGPRRAAARWKGHVAPRGVTVTKDWGSSTHPRGRGRTWPAGTARRGCAAPARGEGRNRLPGP